MLIYKEGIQMADYDDPRPSSQPEGSTAMVVAKDNLITLDKIAVSTDLTVTTRKGQERKTWAGMDAGFTDIIDQGEQDIATAIAAAGYQIVGDFADSIVPITDANQVLTSKSVAGFEDYVWRTNQPLPYTRTGSDPTQAPEAGKWLAVSIGELETAMIALNQPTSAGIYDADTVTPIPAYIRSASQQKTYSVPSVAQGQTIISVVGDELEASGGTYTLESVNKSGVEFGIIADVDNLQSLGGKLSHLLIGDSLTVLDYATGNNSGVLFFKVVASGTGVANGGKYIDLPTLGLQLEQNLKKKVDVRSYGAVESYTTDSSVSFQNALNSHTNVYADGGPYLVGNIDFNEGNKLIGDTTNSAVESGTMIVPNNTTGHIFSLTRGCNLDGFLFYEPNQVYEMTSDYINESFNQTALPIKINTAAYVNCKNITAIGFNKIVGQDDIGLDCNISAGNFENFRGFALEVAFDIRRSLDVLKFDNIHFNLNSYRSFGKLTVDSWYYTKAALQATVFKFARVDDAHMTNCFAFGVKRFIDIIPNGYTGDNNSGGGLNMTNFGSDVCSQLIACSRSDSAFGYHLANGWSTPIVKPLDSSAQVSVLVGGTATANEVFLANVSQFGNATNPSIDPIRSGLADNFARLEINTIYNRIATSNCQVTQITGDPLLNYNADAYPTRNTFHGDDIILAQQETFSVRDLDGLPALTIDNKKVFTHGINNNGLSTGEGISSGTFTVLQGAQSNVNAGTITFGTFATYTKVGSVVSYSGQITVPSLASGQVDVYIAPPLPFNSDAGRGAGGVIGKQMGVYVEKLANDIKISFVADDASSHQISFNGQYYLL